MTREIVFHRLARADLFDIYDYIERQSGPVRARDYLGRIEEACNGLKDFPEKGTPRHDIAAGLRTWAIEQSSDHLPPATRTGRDPARPLCRP